jgi:hypothetical protein
MRAVSAAASLWCEKSAGAPRKVGAPASSVFASGIASLPQLRQNRSFKGISVPQFEQIISFIPAKEIT